MPRLWCLASMVLLAAAAATAQSNESSSTDPDHMSLEGLWAARQRYGPDVRGALLFYRRDGELRADIAGFSVPVQERGRNLSFALPDGKGNLRGVRSGGNIIGQWIQPMTALGMRSFATPVTLRADGRELWSGEVTPLMDRMTYYLPITRDAEGRYVTYLRNPERNLGLFLGVSRIETAGDTVRLIGTRRGQQEESMLAAGRRNANPEMLTLPLYGGTFDFERDADSSSAFYPRGNPGAHYHYSPPVQLNDGWPVATLEQEGISRKAIERFVQKLIDTPQDNASSSQIHSLLIARHGRLVLEEYFHGYDRDTPHDMRSAAKSWTAVLIGAAMQAKIPIRLDTPVYQTMLGTVPPHLDPRKRAMTVEHLITMTAGFDCAENNPAAPGNEDVMQDQTKEPDWYRYTMNVPMISAPGEKVVYCSAEANLAAGVLERIAREPLPELFERLVAKPMHMERYHLILTPTGTAYGGGGHYFLPRDFLKLAQLMVDDGRWEGRQIISREWARRSGAALRNLTPTQTYGYLWNSVEYSYRGRKVHAFFAAGNGGQIFMGVPELDLVIGFTGGNYGDNDVLRIPQRVFVPEDILPAVQ